MTDQVRIGRAASVAFGSFGVLYGRVAVAAGARVRLWATRVSGANVQNYPDHELESKMNWNWMSDQASRLAGFGFRPPG